jgi:hypothetical protein
MRRGSSSITMLRFPRELNYHVWLALLTPFFRWRRRSKIGRCHRFARRSTSVMKITWNHHWRTWERTLILSTAPHVLTAWLHPQPAACRAPCRYRSDDLTPFRFVLQPVLRQISISGLARSMDTENVARLVNPFSRSGWSLARVWIGFPLHHGASCRCHVCRKRVRPRVVSWWCSPCVWYIGCRGSRVGLDSTGTAFRANGRRRKLRWTKAQSDGPNHGNTSPFIIRYRLFGFIYEFNTVCK